MIKPVEKLNPLRAAQNGKLSPATVELAWRYLSGEFRDAIKLAEFGLSESEKAGLSDDMIYAKTVKLIAEQAPLRLISGEKLVGSATLYEATKHNTPACDYRATSHVTIGFDRVLKSGIGELYNRVEQRLSDNDLSTDQHDFLLSMRICIEAMRLWHQRQLELLLEMSSGNDKWQKVLSYF